MFQKKSDSEQILRIKEGAGITSLRRRSFFSLPKNFAGGTILCFRKFLISKKIMYKKGGWEFNNLPSKFFCLCAENFRR